MSIRRHASAIYPPVAIRRGGTRHAGGERLPPPCDPRQKNILVAGGLATVHADDAQAALLRLEELILEVSATPMSSLIARAINETKIALFVTYLPPILEGSRRVKKIAGFVLGEDEDEAMDATNRNLRFFEDKLSEIETALTASKEIRLQRMRCAPEETDDGKTFINAELLQALNYVVNGRWNPVALPPCPTHLDTMLARDMLAGHPMIYDDNRLAVVSVMGYPQGSYPGILHALALLLFELRFSNRFIFTDFLDASGQLSTLRKRWAQKTRGFMAQIFDRPNAPGTLGIDPAAIAMMQEGADPNGQQRKQKFLRGTNGGASMTRQGYSTSVPIPQQFRWELKAGTLIPGILITGINSDLPGTIAGQVSENVWDSTYGSHILIPKGTKIIGVYDSEIKYGQRRVLLVWNRLVFPNGTSLNIAGSPGVDQAGYSGLTGKVDAHWGQIFATALLASLFVAGAEIVYDDNSSGGRWGYENKSPSDAAAESVANSILDMSSKMLDKASDIQPTIQIRPGKRFGIFVQEDVAFPYPYPYK